MRHFFQILIVLLGFSLLFAATDTLRSVNGAAKGKSNGSIASSPQKGHEKSLRIDAEIPGAWYHGEWFLNELEAMLQGMNGMHVISRQDIRQFLSKASIQPARRDSTAAQLIAVHFPAPFVMQVRLAPPVSQASRAPVLFFMGERTMQMGATVRFAHSDAQIPELRGDFSVDTVLAMGFCGILDCVVKHPDAQNRQLIEQALFQKLLAKIQGRMEQLLLIPSNHQQYLESEKVRYSRDSLRVVDSVKVVRYQDSVRKAQELLRVADSLRRVDSLKAASAAPSLDSAQVKPDSTTETSK